MALLGLGLPNRQRSESSGTLACKPHRRPHPQLTAFSTCERGCVYGGDEYINVAYCLEV